MTDCKYHLDHETRIKNLEEDMKEQQRARINPAIWVALITFCGTLGTALAQVAIAAYLK